MSVFVLGPSLTLVRTKVCQALKASNRTGDTGEDEMLAR